MEYVKLSKDIKYCPHDDCGEFHPRIYKDKFEQAVFYAEYKSAAGAKREELFNHHINQILGRISNDTVLKLGKPVRCHPKNFILDIIRIAPNTIRPDIRQNGEKQVTAL